MNSTTADNNNDPETDPNTDVSDTEALPEDYVSMRTWFTVWGSVIGAFIAVLNIMITNSSLKEIQGALSATLHEGSFISTAYLTAEVIVIPLTGWLVQVFGLRRFVLTTSLVFMAATMACAMAWNLESMLVFRTIAGFAGGSFIALSFTVILTLLPPSKQPLGIAMFSLTATQAPSIGPTLGGYLTETIGWQSIFYMQIIPTILMFAILSWGLEKSKGDRSLLKTGDWTGIIMLSVALGSMIIILEEGNRLDWFESQNIVRATAFAGGCFLIFLYRQLWGNNAFINLRLFKRWNFTLANILGVILGLGLYGTIFITPLYLAQIQDYNAWQTGVTMMWFGFPQLIMVPILVKLMKTVDPRHLVCVGCIVFGWSCMININMNAEYAYEQLLLANFIRGIGQPLLSIPLAVIATVGIEQAQVGSASGLYNLTRNLGGAVGIAFLATFLSIRQQFHSSYIVENISLYNPLTVERLEGLQGYFTSLGADTILAQEQALRTIDAVARRDSYVMAYNDAFFFVGAAFWIGAVLTYLIKKPTPPAGKA
ncbi:MAG: DHA2 family efflux MFS transporter permease subunit [Porticoccaceae bacterium]|nr:DHA2 family efflux MFS transporter permease subunit [Porticoccaceae bacterium]